MYSCKLRPSHLLTLLLWHWVAAVVWAAANALKALVEEAAARQAAPSQPETHEDPRAVNAQLQALCTFAVRADRKLRLPPSKLEQLAAWMTLA